MNLSMFLSPQAETALVVFYIHPLKIATQVYKLHCVTKLLYDYTIILEGYPKEQ